MSRCATVLLVAGCGGGTALIAAARSPAAGAPGVATFHVPSPAMLPTLQVGSVIEVNLHAYRARNPSIGDIVVFHPPKGADSYPAVCGAANEGRGRDRLCGVPSGGMSSEKFVERVVGLPGDRIAMTNGHVIRNGKRERDLYIAACSDRWCNFAKAVVIPRGDYLMMGDNRGASFDGRFWGPVPKSWTLGKVVRIHR